MPTFVELTEKSQLIQDDSHCVYCHTDLMVFEEVAICHECGSPHHSECWRANSDRCATFGCTGSGGDNTSRAREVVRRTSQATTATTRQPNVQPHTQRRSIRSLLNGRRFIGILAFIGLIIYTSVFEANPFMRQFVQPFPSFPTPMPVAATPRPTAAPILAASPTATPILVANSPLPPPSPFTTCAEASGIDPSDCAVLLNFYSSTVGPDWTFNMGWLKNDTPCEWYGVDCEGSRVARINLSHNKLKGTLPADIGSLDRLTRIGLSGNGLTGELPSSLGQLQNLQSLRLNQNQLSGEIPGELSQLTALQVLNLSSNNLGGEVSVELACLPNLQTSGTSLSFDYNRLRAADDAAAQCIKERSNTWVSTQTVPPTNVQIEQTSSTQLRLTWTPISNSSINGYYEVGRSDDGGATFTVLAKTENIKDASITVEQVPAETSLYAVRSVTQAWTNQKNELISEYSTPVTITLNPEVDAENDGG